MENPNQDPSAKDFYSKANFWDQRYQAGGYFDWYAEYPQLKYAFENHYGMSKQDHILMVGCGNSQLSQQMYEAGYRNICNIDISPTVIQQMKKISPSMEWIVMDATNMTFEDNKFDYVIDKGTMDALIAGRDLTPAIKLLQECMRVTKEEGQLIQITYGSPQGRKKVFQNSLPFDLFDYYFAYVNLNDMSTMINLMRNNLIGPDGQRVEKQLALQKSLREFMMIKIMRAKRSKEKQFVVWQQLYKKSQNQGRKRGQQPVKVQNKQSGQGENKQTKMKDQTTQKINENKEQSSEDQNNQQKIQSESIKFQSKPQKQSYVYAYSIKRKFAYNFHPQQYEKCEIKQFYESSSTGSTPLCLRGSKEINKSISQCITYCEQKQISHSSVHFLERNQAFPTNDESIKVNLDKGKSISINVLTKSSIDLRFILLKDYKKLLECLKHLGGYLVQKMGLSFHPCPKTYSLFSMIKGRMNAKSINELLQEHWYPTYSINLENQKRYAQVYLSVPPVLPEILEKVKALVIGYFSQKGGNQLIPQISKTRNGYVSFPPLSLFSALNMASLSYNQGKSLKVSMNQVYSINQNNQSEQQSKFFIISNSHAQAPQQLIPITLLHLMCFC